MLKLPKVELLLNQFDVLTAVEEVVDLLLWTHVINRVVALWHSLEHLTDWNLLRREYRVLLVYKVNVLYQSLGRLSILNGEELSIVHYEVVQHHHIVQSQAHAAESGRPLTDSGLEHLLHDLIWLQLEVEIGR